MMLTIKKMPSFSIPMVLFCQSQWETPRDSVAYVHAVMMSLGSEAPPISTELKNKSD